MSSLPARMFHRMRTAGWLLIVNSSAGPLRRHFSPVRVCLVTYSLSEAPAGTPPATVTSSEAGLVQVMHLYSTSMRSPSRSPEGTVPRERCFQPSGTEKRKASRWALKTGPSSRAGALGRELQPASAVPMTIAAHTKPPGKRAGRGLDMNTALVIGAGHRFTAGAGRQRLQDVVVDIAAQGPDRAVGEEEIDVAVVRREEVIRLGVGGEQVAVADAGHYLRGRRLGHVGVHRRARRDVDHRAAQDAGPRRHGE